MAKVLSLKNKDFSPAYSKNNNGDRIAVYEDSDPIYTLDDYIKLPEYLELIKITDWKDDVSATVKAFTKKVAIVEQQLINMGVFELTHIPGTRKEVGAMFNAKMPQKKTVWVDPDTGISKELIEEPQYPVKIINGVISHNYDTPENAKVINEVETEVKE